MIIMLAPGTGVVFTSTPSGTVYISDNNSLIYIVNNSVADQLALVGSGCVTLSPFAGGQATLLSGTSYDVQETDINDFLLFTSSSSVSLTLPNSLPIGFITTAFQIGTGSVTAVADTGASVVSPNGLLDTIGQYYSLVCVVISNTTGTDAVWNVISAPALAPSGYIGATTLSDLYAQDVISHFAQYLIGQVFADTSSFTASITSDVMTVTGSVTGSPLAVGTIVQPSDVAITSLGTGTGGAGTYNVASTADLTSQDMTGSGNGSWLKTGSGDGSGNWTQISTLTIQSVSAAVTAEAATRAAADIAISNVTQTIGPDTPVTGTHTSSVTYALGEPLAANGPCTYFKYFGYASGTILLRMFDRAGNTFTQSGPDYPVTIAVGAGILTPTSGLPYIPGTKGQYPGFFAGTGTVGNKLMTTSNPAQSPGFYSSSPAVNVSTFTDASLNSARVEAQFGFQQQVVTGPAFETVLNGGKTLVSLATSDGIIIGVDSHTTGFWCPEQDMAYISRVSQLCDYLVFNEGRPGADILDAVVRLRTDGTSPFGSPPWSANARFFIAHDFSNDDAVGYMVPTNRDYWTYNLMRLADAANALGAFPILVSQFQTEPVDVMNMAAAAAHRGVKFYDGGQYGRMLGFALPGSPPVDFEYNSHMSVRTNWLHAQPVLDVIDSLPRPKQGVKYYRYRGSAQYPISTSADLLTLDRNDRFLKWREISISHRLLGNGAELLTIAIDSGGTGYIVNDLVTLVGGTPEEHDSVPSPSIMKVLTVDGSGAILTASINDQGAYAVTSPTFTSTGGTGTSATWKTATFSEPLNILYDQLNLSGAPVGGVNFNSSYIDVSSEYAALTGGGQLTGDDYVLIRGIMRGTARTLTQVTMSMAFLTPGTTVYYRYWYDATSGVAGLLGGQTVTDTDYLAKWNIPNGAWIEWTSFAADGTEYALPALFGVMNLDEIEILLYNASGFTFTEAQFWAYGPGGKDEGPRFPLNLQLGANVATPVVFGVTSDTYVPLDPLKLPLDPTSPGNRVVNVYKLTSSTPYTGTFTYTPQPYAQQFLLQYWVRLNPLFYGDLTNPLYSGFDPSLCVAGYPSNSPFPDGFAGVSLSKCSFTPGTSITPFPSGNGGASQTDLVNTTFIQKKVVINVPADFQDSGAQSITYLIEAQENAPGVAPDLELALITVNLIAAGQ